MSKSFSNRKRGAVSSKTEGKCFYCGDTGTEIDHIVAKAKGGNDKLSNLVMACRSCNGAKREKTIEDFRLYIEVKNSKYGSVINGTQAKKLMALGVNLDIAPHDFWFERNNMIIEVAE